MTRSSLRRWWLGRPANRLWWLSVVGSPRRWPRSSAGTWRPFGNGQRLILSVPALRSRAREQNASLVTHLQHALAAARGR